MAGVEKTIFLWVDDERPAPAGWVAATIFAEAVVLLARGGVAVVSLDHDLGSVKDDENGYALACMLENSAVEGRWDLVPDEIRCHSANSVGRKRIEAVIRQINLLREAHEGPEGSGL